jgi:hypothetical protein
MKEIPLTQGKVALVDDADFDWLNQWKWYYHYAGAVRNTPRPKRKTVLMHREIFGLSSEDSDDVDHRNHDRLDNRRCNLRICTTTENCHNRYKPKQCSSKFKGVSWHNNNARWTAQIGIPGKLIHLGSFKLEECAALAYDMAALREFGEFAHCNF